MGLVTFLFTCSLNLVNHKYLLVRHICIFVLSRALSGNNLRLAPDYGVQSFQACRALCRKEERLELAWTTLVVVVVFTVNVGITLVVVVLFTVNVGTTLVVVVVVVVVVVGNAVFTVNDAAAAIFCCC